MLNNKPDTHQKRVHPADRKFEEINSGEGKAKNRRGVTFGARNSKHGADKAASKNGNAAGQKTSRKISD